MEALKNDLGNLMVESAGSSRGESMSLSELLGAHTQRELPPCQSIFTASNDVIAPSGVSGITPSSQLTINLKRHGIYDLKKCVIIIQVQTANCVFVSGIHVLRPVQMQLGPKCVIPYQSNGNYTVEQFNCTKKYTRSIEERGLKEKYNFSSFNSQQNTYLTGVPAATAIDRLQWYYNEIQEGFLNSVQDTSDHTNGGVPIVTYAIPLTSIFPSLTELQDGLVYNRSGNVMQFQMQFVDPTVCCLANTGADGTYNAAALAYTVNYPTIIETMMQELPQSLVERCESSKIMERLLTYTYYPSAGTLNNNSIILPSISSRGCKRLLISSHWNKLTQPTTAAITASTTAHATDATACSIKSPISYHPLPPINSIQLYAGAVQRTWSLQQIPGIVQIFTQELGSGETPFTNEYQRCFRQVLEINLERFCSDVDLFGSYLGQQQIQVIITVQSGLATFPIEASAGGGAVVGPNTFWANGDFSNFTWFVNLEATMPVMLTGGEYVEVK